jgi:hypothetical protein
VVEYKGPNGLPVTPIPVPKEKAEYYAKELSEVFRYERTEKGAKVTWRGPNKSFGDSDDMVLTLIDTTEFASSLLPTASGEGNEVPAAARASMWQRVQEPPKK